MSRRADGTVLRAHTVDNVGSDHVHRGVHDSGFQIQWMIDNVGWVPWVLNLLIAQWWLTRTARAPARAARRAGVKIGFPGTDVRRRCGFGSDVAIFMSAPGMWGRVLMMASSHGAVLLCVRMRRGGAWELERDRQGRRRPAGCAGPDQRGGAGPPRPPGPPALPPPDVRSSSSASWTPDWSTTALAALLLVLHRAGATRSRWAGAAWPSAPTTSGCWSTRTVPRCSAAGSCRSIRERPLVRPQMAAVQGNR